MAVVARCRSVRVRYVWVSKGVERQSWYAWVRCDKVCTGWAVKARHGQACVGMFRTGLARQSGIG